ncbi:MAG: glycosyltransferase family 2 protein [Casimicrobiaceae bacterium]
MTMIDVIVPVYRGFAATRRCLDGLFAGAQRTPLSIVAIDDASPEPAIAAYLDELAAQGRIELLRNASNLGFVRTANRGLALHPDRDVVLLNSDAETANDWIERLHACAYRARDIGTVTPFSNNATICSYPYEGWTGGTPGTLGLAGLDRLFASVNAGRHADLPTAVGFCMYIRRACVDAVGMFDAERFGRGYGEENDFCMRAAAAGWRSVIAADVFVFHEGAVSFSGERDALTAAATTALLERHPEYSRRIEAFHAADPLRSLRRAVDDARHALGGDEARQVYAERNDELASTVARDAERIAVLRAALAHAQRGVAERDAEIAKLTPAFRHAETLALERGRELERINASPLLRSLRRLTRR